MATESDDSSRAAALDHEREGVRADSRRKTKRPKVVRRFRTRYADVIELEVNDRDRIFKIVVKRPINGGHEPLNDWSRRKRKSHEILTANIKPDSKVRFPKLVGTFDSGQGLAMEYAPGERLDSILQAPWKARTLERALTAVEEVGKWLSAFHADHREHGTGTQRTYPHWIRPYQQGSGSPIHLRQSLMEMGLKPEPVGKLLEKLEDTARTVMGEARSTTMTYGDFRAWNMLVARDATYIIDFPTELSVDTPWRDICAFLTSVDYVMARPRAIPARFVLKPQTVKSRFIRGYFESTSLDTTAIEMMEIPAMVASWEDLKEFHRIRDAATRTWLEWRIKRAMSRHLGDST